MGEVVWGRIGHIYPWNEQQNNLGIQHSIIQEFHCTMELNDHMITIVLVISWTLFSYEPHSAFKRNFACCTDAVLPKTKWSYKPGPWCFDWCFVLSILPIIELNWCRLFSRRKRRSSSSSSHSSPRRKRSRSADRDKGRSHRSHRSRSRDRR